MIHTPKATIALDHIASITWAPSQPWHRVVNEIRELLNSVEEDAEVEMLPNKHGEPVLYLSFPRGPLVEFPEGGVLTVCRDTTGVLVAWAGQIRRHTPLGDAKAKEIVAEANRLTDEERSRTQRRGTIAVLFTFVAIVAYPFAIGLMTIVEGVSS